MDSLESTFLSAIKEVKKCTICGKCCYNRAIFLTLEELERIKEYTGMKATEFAELFPTPIQGLFMIKLKNKLNGACIFLDEETNKCKIHEVKPLQCKTYPIIFNELITPLKEGGGYLYFECETGDAVYKIKKKRYHILKELREKMLAINYAKMYAEAEKIRKEFEGE